MSNLYSITTNPAAIAALFGAIDRLGRIRRPAARAVGWSQGAAAAVARKGAEDRGARGSKGRCSTTGM